MVRDSTRRTLVFINAGLDFGFFSWARENSNHKKIRKFFLGAETLITQNFKHFSNPYYGL